jgi:hypothetical protein
VNCGGNLKHGKIATPQCSQNSACPNYAANTDITQSFKNILKTIPHVSKNLYAWYIIWFRTPTDRPDIWHDREINLSLVQPSSISVSRPNIWKQFTRLHKCSDVSLSSVCYLFIFCHSFFKLLSCSIWSYHKVVMKSTVFWDITSCSPFESQPRFGRIFRLHLHRRRISLRRKQRQNRWQVGIIRRPCRQRQYIPLKRRLSF